MSVKDKTYSFSFIIKRYLDYMNKYMLFLF